MLNYMVRTINSYKDFMIFFNCVPFFQNPVCVVKKYRHSIIDIFLNFIELLKISNKQKFSDFLWCVRTIKNLFLYL